MAQEIYYSWDNGINEWVAIAKSNYTYDSSVYMTQEIYYVWDSDTGTWITSWIFDCIYDSNGNPISEIYSIWDESTGKLTPDGKTVYAYDFSYNLSNLILPPMVVQAGI